MSTAKQHNVPNSTAHYIYSPQIYLSRQLRLHHVATYKQPVKSLGDDAPGRAVHCLCLDDSKCPIQQTINQSTKQAVELHLKDKGTQ